MSQCTVSNWLIPVWVLPHEHNVGEQDCYYHMDRILTFMRMNPSALAVGVCTSFCLVHFKYWHSLSLSPSLSLSAYLPHSLSPLLSLSLPLCTFLPLCLSPSLHVSVSLKQRGMHQTGTRQSAVAIHCVKDTREEVKGDLVAVPIISSAPLP